MLFACAHAAFLTLHVQVSAHATRESDASRFQVVLARMKEKTLCAGVAQLLYVMAVVGAQVRAATRTSRASRSR